MVSSTVAIVILIPRSGVGGTQRAQKSAESTKKDDWPKQWPLFSHSFLWPILFVYFVLFVYVLIQLSGQRRQIRNQPAADDHETPQGQRSDTCKSNAARQYEGVLLERRLASGDEFKIGRVESSQRDEDQFDLERGVRHQLGRFCEEQQATGEKDGSEAAEHPRSQLLQHAHRGHVLQNQSRKPQIRDEEQAHGNRQADEVNTFDRGKQITRLCNVGAERSGFGTFRKCHQSGHGYS